MIWYDIPSHQVSILLNTFGRFWIGMWDSALHHVYQNTKWRNIIWKNGIYHLSKAPETSRESEPRCTEAVLSASWWCNTLYFVSFLNWSPICTVCAEEKIKNYCTTTIFPVQGKGECIKRVELGILWIFTCSPIHCHDCSIRKGAH